MRVDVTLTGKINKTGVQTIDNVLQGENTPSAQSRPLKSEQEALQEMIGKDQVSKFSSNVGGGDDPPMHVVSPTTAPQDENDDNKQLSPRADEMTDERGATSTPGKQINRARVSDEDARNYGALYKSMWSKSMNDSTLRLAVYRVLDDGKVELL